MSAPTKNVVDLPVSTSVERTDKLLLVDIDDTSEGPLGTVKIAEASTVAEVFELELNAAALSATQAADSAAAAAAITGLSTVQNFTNPLSRAIRVAMTAAASGSNGIQVLDNVQADFGTGNYSLVRRYFLASTRPSANQILSQKHDGTNGRIITLLTTGVIRHTINGTNYDSTVALASATNVILDLFISVVRSSASAAGSVAIYNSGVQLGATITITAGAPVSVDNAVSEYILGTSTTRVAGEVYNWLNYNRALTASEVLSLAVNGPALADIGASQTPVYTSDFSAGVDGWSATRSTVDGNIDGIGGQDNWLRTTISAATGLHVITRSASMVVGKKYRISFTYYLPSANANTSAIRLRNQTGESSIAGSTVVESSALDSATTVTAEITAASDSLQFVFLSTSGLTSYTGNGTDLFYVKNIVVTSIGITGQWNASDAQSDTGQIFDSSGNKNHALLPAAGATIIGAQIARMRQVRWTNTWNGTQELQYIGGVNQNILPANAYIESIVGVITGATVEDIIIGDGTTTNRYVTITTGLAAGTATFTLANRTPTNSTALKLTVDPDTNCNMSIAWTIIYRGLE